MSPVDGVFKRLPVSIHGYEQSSTFEAAAVDTQLSDQISELNSRHLCCPPPPRKVLSTKRRSASKSRSTMVFGFLGYG